MGGREARVTPRVSVVMPVRDGERFLREALESTLAQTVAELELIVVDDGSTDATPAILAECAERDGRVRVQRQEPGGLTVALNAGCAHAQAPVIARMDADDVMLPDRLERQLAYLDAHPDVALLGGGIVLVDESGAEIDREPGRAELDFLARNELTHATVAMRTEAFRALGGYRLDQAEDYDLWLRFEERGGVAALPDFVLRYRLHPGPVLGHGARAPGAGLSLRTGGRDRAPSRRAGPARRCRAARRVAARTARHLARDARRHGRLGRRPVGGHARPGRA